MRALCIGLLVTMACATASAAEDGLDAYLEGKQLYKDGNYGAALGRFQHSYAISGKGVNLYNIAECHRRLGNAEAAVEYYGRYLAAPDATADVRARVEARLQELLRARRADPKPQASAPVRVAPPVAVQAPAAAPARADDTLVRVGALVGPALPQYGTDSVPHDPTVEFGVVGGHEWTLGKRLGIDASFLALFVPVSYDAEAESGTVWFSSFLVRPGLTVRHRAWRGLIGLGAGVTVLTGANRESPFFSGAFEVDGAFLSYLLRPEIDVLVDVGPRVTLLFVPFALDYGPAFPAFTNPEVEHVSRLHFAAGVLVRL